eukprot:TRINITY_DN10282_c0_g1_i1.p1 TRINITY_DN10282_c0_g1~~TRINITY_DN10282_c0_g1_i1.p1  ORF type:complete len:184 (+),score=37.41 TRINITY_DN10282_c0_g1_i1:138-689(+)
MGFTVTSSSLRALFSLGQPSSFRNYPCIVQQSPIASYRSFGKVTKWKIMADDEPETSEREIKSQEEQSGRGFGAPPKNKKSLKKKKSSTVIRREAPQKPLLAPQADSQLQQNEGLFLLSWAGLGILILVEGAVLAASGFLPEEWDRLLTKYLYPAFTPTVVIFLVGTSAYGLYKYFGGGLKKS